MGKITKDILDENGNVVGQLSVSDTTPQVEIDAALAPYAVAPEPVNDDLSSVQLRKALYISNISDTQINDVLNSLSEPEQSFRRIEWEHGTSFSRKSDFVITLTASLKLGDDEVDALWKEGAAL